jgi:CheY-like chemotaxis protein
MSSADNLSRYFSGRINLLVVEDEGNLLSALVEIFSVPCFKVTGASSMKEARKAVARRDTIWHSWIVDMSLAGNDDAGAALIEENRNFPFAVVYSGLQSMENAAHAIQKGAAAVIDKGSDSVDKLIREVCGLAPLALLCKGTLSKNREFLFLLKSHTLRGAAEWAETAKVTIRQIEYISQTHTGMTPSMVVFFYYGLRYLLLSGFGMKGELLHNKEEESFYQDCLLNLQKNIALYQKILFQ